MAQTGMLAIIFVNHLLEVDCVMSLFCAFVV
jgi:hypothetical protein